MKAIEKTASLESVSQEMTDDDSWSAVTGLEQRREATGVAAPAAPIRTPQSPQPYAPQEVLRSTVRLVGEAQAEDEWHSEIVRRGEAMFMERLRKFDMRFAAGMDAVSACNRKNQKYDTIICSHDPEKLLEAIEWFRHYIGVDAEDMTLTVEVRPENRHTADELLGHWAAAIGVRCEELEKPVVIYSTARRPCDDRRASFGALQVRFRRRLKTELVLGAYDAKRKLRQKLNLMRGRITTSALFDMTW